MLLLHLTIPKAVAVTRLPKVARTEMKATTVEVRIIWQMTPVTKAVRTLMRRATRARARKRCCKKKKMTSGGVAALKFQIEGSQNCRQQPLAGLAAIRFQIKGWKTA
jgi:hypothetical protein